MRPPELAEFAEADYPPEELAERREGRVVLRLTIDTEGAVTEAEVVEPAGGGFDEAARQAALRFRFEPALRNGEPVPARILYTYEFELPPPATGDVAGQVTLPDSNEPAVGVEVTLTGDSGATRAAHTDAEGRFRIEGLAPGRHRLHINAPGIGTAELPVAVAAGETASPRLTLLPHEGAEPIEVTVRGESEVEQLRQSAQAVQVIEVDEAKRQTADLGEVLARSHGFGVQRLGGLGSGARYSMNGLGEDQIRFFLDGIPLELAGYPFGLANIPVNLIDRVEIYRGVVPIRFGADALGGAVNLVSDEDLYGTHGSVSYQAGSFGTQRSTLGARHLHEPSGFFVRVGGFFDHSDNDYEVDVEVPDEVGRLSPTTVHRFHDAYTAGGGSVEMGFVDRPWADRLMVRGFATAFSNEVQHNIVMSVPYGDVEYGALATGANVRYEHRPTDDLTIELLAAYAYTVNEFQDVGECVYDWFGQCIDERPTPGEIERRPRDQITWWHDALGRVNLGWQVHPQHELRLSVTPRYSTRTGNERRQADPAARDPLTAERDLFAMVTGLEYEADFLDDRLENIFFAKDYLQLLRSEEPLPGNTFRDRNRNTHRFGVGNSLRYRFTEWLFAKASYEWTTRLPRPEEIFGDGRLIVANLELDPEVSHNANLGVVYEDDDTLSGSWKVEVHGFLRETDQLIVLLGNDTFFSYQNVFGARSAGVESELRWTSPGDFVALRGNATYVDFRNTSGQGTFGDFKGDRIPNRPYLFANGMARLQLDGVAAEGDRISLEWNTRYVHDFFRSWESVGLREFKQTIDPQLLHSLALTYLIEGDPVAISFTAEAQNITDAQAFDFFGVQRPGRAFYFKTIMGF